MSEGNEGNHDTSFDAASFRGACLMRGRFGVGRLVCGRFSGACVHDGKSERQWRDTTRFADPNDRVKNFESQGSRPFGQNGPVVQFGAGQPYSRPFGRYAPPPAITGGNN